MRMLLCFGWCGCSPDANPPSVPANAVHVFILAGQSNMEGQVDMDHPRYYNGGKGNLLQSMAATPERYAHLKDAEGKVRDDVHVRFRNRQGVMAGG